MTAYSNPSSLRKRLNQILADRRSEKTNLQSLQSQLEERQQSLSNVQQAQQILQEVAQGVQQQAHRHIASVVSRCLTTVFAEDAYEFEIRFEQKRGRTEARIVFVRDGHDVSPTSGSGGGVLDVAAFALRLACLMLRRPASRRLLIMDEPLKNLHSEIYQVRARQMIEQLASELNFQFIVVTGLDWLQCGKIIDLNT